MVSVTELDAKNAGAWDSYVASSPNGLAHHLSGWRQVLQRTYGFDAPFLMARDKDDGRVVGVLPLYILRSFLVGNSAVTMQGGLCADDQEAGQALINAGREVARQARVRQLLIQDTRQAWPGELATSHLHVYWRVPLTPDPDALRKRVDRNVRRQARQGREYGVTVEPDETGAMAGTFYDIMSRFTHQMGTPVFGRRFVDNLVEAFPGGFVIHIVRHEGAIVGAYFSMPVGNTVHSLWGASLRQSRRVRASYAAYWEILLDFARRGYAFFDMGRSPLNSSGSEFKQQWGGTSHPVYQQSISLNGARPAQPMSARVRSDDRLQFFARAWSRLPFTAHRYLGPRLRRHVPFG